MSETNEAVSTPAETTAAPAEAAPAAPAPAAEAPKKSTSPDPDRFARALANAMAKTKPKEETKPEEPPADEPAKAEAKPTEAAKEAEAPKEPVLPSAILKKERELMAQEKALRDEQNKIAAQRAEVERLRASPDLNERLKALGMTFHELVDFNLGIKKADPKPSKDDEPVADLRAQLAELRQSVEQDRAAEAERQARAAEAQNRAYTRELLAKSGDKYELSLKANRADAIFDRMYGYFQDAGKLPGDGSFESAFEYFADEIEKALELETEALLTTKKLSSKLQAVSPKPAERPSANPGQSTKPVPRTLTNSQAAAVPPRTAGKWKSVDEKIAEVAAKVSLFKDA